ncbi:nuclear transport factor 2 family protein [Streptomyces sp. WMMC500]|uniref:nuclear transport factor 2 family protein n=1 Tax=Streptomyces sp. WMMC500 TaxID=3015154 RepID=UPI00248B1573|nr:nuclear transport factor 2 family protein [Streptomyces sp. WMMC500]WBB62007.1 nuclear transport factor 2 family protein [Streptomyces sp. WMMC500]
MRTVDISPYDVYVMLPRLRATWPARDERKQQIVVIAGLQAVELCLRLAADTLDDSRAESCPEERLRRITQCVVDSCALIASDLGCTEPQQRRTPLSAKGVAILRRLPAEATGAITLALRTVRWPYLTPDVRAKVEAVHEMCQRPWRELEDPIFRTVHQFTECWLRIALHQTDRAAAEADAGSWSKAAVHVDQAARAVELVTSNNDMLELMVPSDFHPLRVRLRDGTAADSRAAHEMLRRPRALLGTLQEALACRQSSLAALLDQPRADPAAYRYLRATASLAKRCQTFLLHHYQLVLDVLGTQTRGTLGKEVERLATHAVRPLLPALNQARHDLALVAVLRYGAWSGEMLLAAERATGLYPYPPEALPGDCPESLVGERVDAYFRAIRDRNAAAWTALFDPVNGMLLDIAGTRPFVGRSKLKVFIESTFETFLRIEPDYTVDSISRGRASVNWRMSATSYLGTNVTFPGTEVFTFAADGAILRAEAEWDSYTVAKQVWQHESEHWERTS